MHLHQNRDSMQNRVFTKACYGLLVLAFLSFVHNSGLRAEPAEDVIAVVNEHVVYTTDFTAFFNNARRQTFYHGMPPPAELEAFRVKTMRELINRLLLLDEAKRRGLEPDAEAVEAQVQRQVTRYQGNPNWEENKDTMLASVRQQQEASDIIRQLEAITRDVEKPTEEELIAYHQTHPDTFTEPRQLKVSLILMGVDPSASQEDWAEARQGADTVIDRLRAGDDFATLAREYSSDRTAQNGGDMGYLHEGMLSTQAQGALSELKPGQISAPVETLEGIAVFRLDAIRQPLKKPLSEVRERAVSLWQRDEAERAWSALIEKLRQTATIDIKDPSLAMDPESTESGR